jgi:hypothetical protein
MYAMPYDLLARHLGVTESRVRGVVLRWRRAGLAASGSLNGSPAWCWITPAGMARLGYEWDAQPPALSRLAHIRAVAASRMWLEAGDAYRQWRGRWRPERALRAAAPGVGTRGHVTDGEVIWPPVEGSPYSSTTWAVEAELTPKTVDRTREIMAGLLSRYAHVVYLTASPAARTVAEAASGLDEARQARLTIRPVPPAALPPATATGGR